MITYTFWYLTAVILQIIVFILMKIFRKIAPATHFELIYPFINSFYLESYNAHYPFTWCPTRYKILSIALISLTGPLSILFFLTLSFFIILILFVLGGYNLYKRILNNTNLHNWLSQPICQKK